MTFTLHMAWHMMLVTVAAPIAAAAIAGTRRDPVRAAPAIFSPLVACLIEFVIVWGWHTPALHAAARHQDMWFAAEQLSFAAAALFLWLSIIGGEPRERRTRAGSGVIALVLTFAHMIMLGVLIALAPRDLYGHGALADQQIGGAVMVIGATIVFPAAAVWLLYPAIAARAAPESRP
jgi:putative membrane protein